MDKQIRVEYGYVWTWKFLNQQRKIRVEGPYFIHTLFTYHLYTVGWSFPGVQPLASITVGVNGLSTVCTVPLLRQMFLAKTDLKPSRKLSLNIK